MEMMQRMMQQFLASAHSQQPISLTLPYTHTAAAMGSESPLPLAMAPPQTLFKQHLAIRDSPPSMVQEPAATEPAAPPHQQKAGAAVDAVAAMEAAAAAGASELPAGKATGGCKPKGKPKGKAKGKSKGTAKGKAKGKAQGKAKNGAKGKLKSPSKGILLGCGKCRGAHWGCVKCRDPNFSGKRWQK